MNIGLVFAIEKRSGGKYQYFLNMIDALKLIPAHNYFIFNFSPDFPYKIIKSGNNWQVINLCSKRPKDAIGIEKSEKEFNWKQLILRFIDKLRLYKLKMYLIEQNSKRKIRVFYKYNLDLIFYPSVSEFSYLLKVPPVIAVHDLQHRLNPQFPEVSKMGQYVIREHLFKRAVKVAKYIFVDSEVGKEDVINCYRVPAERVIILPFIPPRYLDRNISEKEIKYFLKKNNLPEKFIFYPAQFWPHKNHQNLVKALAILKKKNTIVPLVLVGSKKEEWSEFDRVMKLVKDSTLKKQVYYLGYVHDREMGILYKLAVALIMPTFFGPTNIPVLEAWKMGCPVLYSDIRGCREQAGDAALLFDPSDPEDIAEKIKIIWEDDDLRNELTLKGKQRFSKWTQKDFHKKIEQIISNFEKENAKR